MKKTLNEELERYLTLSKYNTKLTLTENLKMISEISPAAAAKDVEMAFKSIEGMRNYLGIAKDTGSVTKLLQLGPEAFEKQLIKAFEQDIKNGIPKGELGPIAKEISKIDVIRKIAADSKIKGSSLTADEVAIIIKDVKSENKLKSAKFEPKVPKQKKPVNADDMGKAEREFERVTDPNKKSWDWKRWKKWALGAGITAAALYALYRATKGEEPPVIDDDNIVPTVTQVPQPSTYTNCPETFPIAMYCKNETIRKVQGCLKIKADSAFGPKTQAALEAKNLPGTEITQDTVDTVCGGGTTNDWTDAETEDITSANTSGSAGGATTGGGATSSSDDMG